MRVLLVSFLFALAACGGGTHAGDDTTGDDTTGDDAGPTDGGSPDATPDAGSCGCAAEANASVACTAFDTCASTCDDGFSRCGDACVAESPAQCGAGCAACPSPSHGAPTCASGVCGVACEPGYVPCDDPTRGAALDCCVYTSEIVAASERGGYAPAIAVDAAGTAHVAYTAAHESEVRYASGGGASWSREAATLGFFGGPTQIAVTPRGPIILFAYRYGDTLQLAEKRSTGWSVSTVLAEHPAGFAMVTDRAGRAHVCITGEQGGVRYALREGDRWTIVPVTDDVDATGACAIAVDDGGEPHIAYYRAGAADVIYAHRDGGGFVTAPVDTVGDVGSQLAIAVGPDGKPQIAAYRADVSALRHATLGAGGWAVESVGTGTIGETPAIAITGSGVPVMTYWDGDAYRMVAVVRTNTGWMKTTFEDIAQQGAAMTTAPDGTVWSVVGDNGTVLAYHLVGSVWTPGEVDAVDSLGSEITMLPGPVFVYSDEHPYGHRHVVVQRRAGASWTTTTLSIEGSQPSAVEDSAGKLHIAFIAEADTTARYAVEGTSGFTIENVGGTYAGQPSLALDAAGTPRIAYVDTTGLVVRVRGASSWSAATVTSTGQPTRPVLRVDGAGTSHVLWNAYIGHKLMYASSADGFSNVTIDGTNAGDGHDLFLDPSSGLHVCYTVSGTETTMHYAHRSGATWSTVIVPTPANESNAAACAIGEDAGGAIAIARGLLYGAGLEELVISDLAGHNAFVRDDFYAYGLALGVGSAGLEVAAAGQPYDGSGDDAVKLRWGHR